MKNRKGFTLIELLAVIVILAILMTLSITAMSGSISDARKDTLKTTALQYVGAARLNFVNSDYTFPASGECLAVKTNSIELESGAHESSFGYKFTDNSYVIIYNNAVNGQDQYDYYIQMEDSVHNGFGMILENDLSRGLIKEKRVNSEVNFVSDLTVGSKVPLYKASGDTGVEKTGECTVSQVIG